MDKRLFQEWQEQLERDGLNPNSDESQKWFFEKIDEIGKQNVNRKEVLSQEPIAQNMLIGQMFLFFYNPMTAQELPYFDRFPLIFLLEMNKDDFMGLNLHYLPIDLRQRMFYQLLPRRTSNEMLNNTRLKIDMNYLNSRLNLRMYKACIKRYKFKSVVGRMAKIPAYEWEVAAHMPLALWRKAPESRVHKDSRIIARKLKR